MKELETINNTNFPRKKLLNRGNTAVRCDNINDYYDVNLKHARLNELGIDTLGCAPLGAPVNLSRYRNHNYYKLNLLNRVSV
jgi:UDP-glucuronate 4-epimerase